jgi:hypothetical protein
MQYYKKDECWFLYIRIKPLSSLSLPSLLEASGLHYRIPYHDKNIRSVDHVTEL